MALAAVVAVVTYMLLRSSLETNNALAGVVGGLLALAAAINAVARWLDARRMPVDVDAEGAALAAELLNRWRPELATRRERSGEADALSVRWRQVNTSAKPNHVVTGNPDQAVLDIAKAFRALPKQRAVLLGEPGGGKTFLAISLVVGMLSERAPDDKVPVLLSLSAWDPVEDDLDTFIVRALAAVHYNGAERIPQALLDADAILPVLDGLDELPEHLRRRALSRVNATLAGNRRILLTCRSVEYAEGIAAGAPALRQSPVFEVMPLTSGQIARRLKSNAHWSQIAEAVDRDPAGPLGIALSTPLMLSLFTRAYLGRNPADLLTLTSGNDVRDQLVDVLIDSVYPEQGKRWTADQARGYLTYLARYLNRHSERELSWWKLPNSVLSPWIGALVGLIGGAVGAAVLVPLDIAPKELFESPYLAAGVFGLVCSALWFLGLTRRLSQGRPGFPGGARDGALLVSVPVSIGLVMVLLTEGSRQSPASLVVDTATFVCAGAALAAVAALALGFHGHLVARAAVVGRAEPDNVLRRERKATLFGALTTLVVVIVLSPVLIVALAVGTHVGQRVAATLDIPIVIEPVFDSVSELNGSDMEDVVVTAVVLAVLLVVAVLLTSRWPRYAVAKAVLWSTGQLPMRLEKFLAEARDKGLLRAGVAGYEFWHVTLQERLVVRGKEMRTGRPVVRAAATWLAAIVAVSAVVVFDLTQPEACASTELPHADSTMITVVGKDGTSQCAAKLDTTDVAKLLGGAPEAEAAKVFDPGGTASDRRNSRVTIFGQFSDMSTGTFQAIVKGMKALRPDEPFELYTLPRNDSLADSVIPMLWSRFESGSAAFLLRSDGSVLVIGKGMHSLTTKDPVEIARAAIEHTVGTRSSLPAEAVLDGIDAKECAVLEAERFTKTIDLRGRSVDDSALETLNRCGTALVVTDQRISSQYQSIKVYLTEEPIRKAHQCRRAMPYPADVSAVACTVAELTREI